MIRTGTLASIEAIDGVKEVVLQKFWESFIRVFRAAQETIVLEKLVEPRCLKSIARSKESSPASHLG